MQSKSFRLVSVDGLQVFVRQWVSDEPVRASIIIAHGAAEHGGRYHRVASALAAHGYAVFAHDHRGHGQTAGSLERAGDAGPDGFNGMIRDLRQLVEWVRARNPVPIILLGHSMGAALSQRFIELHGDLLAGVILSGSPGLRPNLDQVAAATASLAEGDSAAKISELFSRAFRSYNEDFGPNATGFEWLTRDSNEVQKYVDDPWCGFPFTNRLVAEMSQCAFETAQIKNIACIPKSLPILLISGSQDRVGGNGAYVESLALAYRAAGIANVQVKLYAEGRHEILNETNWQEVHEDVLSWLRGLELSS